MRFSIALVVALALGGLLRAASPEAAATVVVFNASDPVSTDLARYYAKGRAIADDHLIGLNFTLPEEISRAEYNQFIAAPVRAALVGKGWWTLTDGRVTATTIRSVALIKGIPLKIRSEGPTVVPRTDMPLEIGRRDEASVDSELACLGMGAVPTPGPIPNPYFRRFTPILEATIDPGLLLVCRLDAPDATTVRGMIDDALGAERDGLWGWAYVDSGWSQGREGYAEADQWMGTAAAQMREKGIPVLWDKAPETLPPGYPVTDAALYYGWYAANINGPFADGAFRFRHGAIAVHIHSFSAATLNSPTTGWCGPLLERGAAATLGNVYEPYLSLTANLEVFQDRLMAGFTFAEASFCALKGLSWMNVSLGDPLYKPYAAWRGMRSSTQKATWQQYRDIVLAADGDVLKAAPALKEAARQTGSSMFLESLAAVQADGGNLIGSLATIDQALAMDNKPLVRFRLVLEKIGILQATNQKSNAGALVLAEKGRAPGPAQSALLNEIYLRMFPPPPTPTPSASPKGAPRAKPSPQKK